MPNTEKEKPKQLRIWLTQPLYIKVEELRLKQGKVNMKTRDFVHELLEGAIGKK